MANHLFVQTNSPAGNQILVHAWVEDGALTLVETVDTGGVEAGMAVWSDHPLTARSSTTQIRRGIAGM